MQMMSRGCWIVVVDTEGAMILENAGNPAAPDLRLIDRIETPRPDLDQAQRRGAAPKAGAEATDRAKLAETAMVAMLVTRLAFAARQARIARLAIAAPPHLLAAIRERMDADLAQRVAIMLPRSLTNLPLAKIVSTVTSAMERAA